MNTMGCSPNVRKNSIWQARGVEEEEEVAERVNMMEFLPCVKSCPKCFAWII